MALSNRYRDDNISFRDLSDEQHEIKEQIVSCIRKGGYDFRENACLCNSKEAMLLAEKDCFGLPQKVLLCKNCALIYQNPILSEKSLIKLYEEKFRILYGFHVSKNEYFENQKKAGCRIMETMSRYIKIKGVHVLDIGCGAGGVLYPFHQKGAEVCGIDVDDEYLSMGKKKGLNLLREDLMNFNPDKKFDLIIMTDTLEHLPKADQALDKIRNLLSDKGYLFIGVPNIDPTISKFHFLYHLHMLHIWYFDKKTLGNLLNSRGFTVMDVCVERNLEIISQKTDAFNENHKKKRIIEVVCKYAVLKLRGTREAIVFTIRTFFNAIHVGGDSEG